MRIINTFISDTDDIPPYVEISLRQARRKNPGVEIDFISKKPANYFDGLRINWIPQHEIKHPILDDFRKLSWFDNHGTPNTTYPSPTGFWQKTCERLYYLQAHMYNNDYKNVFHFENDVMLYGRLRELELLGEKIKITDMSETQATFAFCYIPNREQMTKLCVCFNALLSKGERVLQQAINDHISEMSLAKMILIAEMIDTFPIFPTENQPFVFDPGSYGQYLGGTNNGHGESFTDPKHYIGKAIMNGNIKVGMGEFPFVVPHGERGKQLFNLHIHSKKLSRFIA